MVLAIPLKLKNRNVYLSYNFETNYYLPYFDINQGLVPIPFATVGLPSKNIPINVCLNEISSVNIVLISRLMRMA